LYIPSSFVEPDQDTLHNFIEQYSFGVLVTHDGNESIASHLPILLDRSVEPHGRLIGHMARANLQWQSSDGKSVLAIFHGPHAYISPTWYEARNVVPTWNYVAVHVYGTIRLEESHDRLLDIVRRYVEFYEADMPQPWTSESADPEFIDKLVDGTVGFTIDIGRIEGKWKLSQNHDKERQRKVIHALRNAGGENQRKIAELMSEQLEK
jgi:transcriptional regulator